MLMYNIVHHGEVYLGNLWNHMLETALGATIVSELKCCKKCGAYLTCTTKGECCPECQWFDPIDNVCMAIPDRKKSKSSKIDDEELDDEVDPDTFLFEDDDEDDDLSDLPPERDSDDEDDEDEDSFDFDDDDDW
jgi:hypothetical protein